MSETGPRCQRLVHTKRGEVVARSEVRDSCLGRICYSGLHGGGPVPATSPRVGPKAREGADLL